MMRSLVNRRFGRVYASVEAAIQDVVSTTYQTYRTESQSLLAASDTEECLISSSPLWSSLPSLASL